MDLEERRREDSLVVILSALGTGEKHHLGELAEAIYIEENTREENHDAYKRLWFTGWNRSFLPSFYGLWDRLVQNGYIKTEEGEGNYSITPQLVKRAETIRENGLLPEDSYNCLRSTVR